MSPNPLFREAALQHQSSPERLDEQLEVTPPRAWLALGALLAVIVVAGLAGGLMRVPITVAGEGAFRGPREFTVFVSAAESGRVRPGMTARVRTTRADRGEGTVFAVAGEPATRGELAAVLFHEDPRPHVARVAVHVILRAGDEPRGTPGAARIVVGEERPLALLLGR